MKNRGSAGDDGKSEKAGASRPPAFPFPFPVSPARFRFYSRQAPRAYFSPLPNSQSVRKKKQRPLRRREVCGAYSPEPRTDVYYFRLNFKISKLGYYELEISEVIVDKAAGRINYHLIVRANNLAVLLEFSLKHVQMNDFQLFPH